MRTIRRHPRPAPTKVRDLMARVVIAGDPRQSLADAAAQMRSSRVSALAVVDGQEIMGILTERDLMRAVADGRVPSDVHISDYMTQTPHTIEAKAEAAQAAAKMVRHGVRHLPVTESGKLVGFLSARDLLALQPWPAKLPIGEPW
jgi:CBS domain-containing protein